MLRMMCLICFVIFIASSCSKSHEPEKAETLLTDAQTQTLQKAKALNDQTKKMEEDRLKVLEEVEGEKK